MNKQVTAVSLLALAMLAAAGALAAAPPTPIPPPPPINPRVVRYLEQVEPGTTLAVSAEANEALVRQYYDQVLNQGRFDAMTQFVSPNYKRYLSANAAPLNAEGQKKRLAGLRAAFPDLQMTIDDLVTGGDLVAVRGTVRGTHRGLFQGLAPTGKQVAVTAVEVVRIQNGKLVEHWGGADNLDLLQQLGAVVSPPK